VQELDRRGQPSYAERGYSLANEHVYPKASIALTGSDGGRRFREMTPSPGPISVH
jgi:hypothetical protein